MDENFVGNLGVVLNIRFIANATPYDYSFTSDCLENPMNPQYNGGIVVNPELKEGLKGWTSFGNAKLQVRRSETGNEFIVASHRNRSFDSVSQDFFMEHEKLYTFSAWVQISHGDDATVVATFRTPTGFYEAGSTKAKSGCWSMLKGGLTVNQSGSAQLYFQSKNTWIDIWVDSVSLQPFTQEEWKSHQYHSIEKVRKNVQPGPNQAALLEQVLREAHAHPAVDGIVMWSAWSPKGCYRMCLTDNNFRNLPTGDVVDKIIREFFGAVVMGTTDDNGFYETSLIHGDYEVKFADFDRYKSEKDVKSTRISRNFKVEALGSSQHVLNIKILGR
ncbi:hypothetical protein L1887_39192 [Cichorium endivia]|nr:hypothetical protein L1887_39192 [Cichorium endivia]